MSFEIMVEDPEAVDELPAPPLFIEAGGPRTILWNLARQLPAGPS